MLKKIILCAVVSAVFVGNVSSMMRAGEAEAGAGARRVVGAEMFGPLAKAFPNICFRSFFSDLKSVAMCEEDTLESLNAKVFSTFDKDPALFDLTIIAGGKHVKSIHDMDHSCAYVMFKPKAS